MNDDHERRAGGRSDRAGQNSRHGKRRDEGAPTGGPPPEFAENVPVTSTERDWIREHLAPFYERLLIVDVVGRVKAGKEATVYTCTGHPSTGRSLIAAKVYRQRSQRSSKNTGLYQQGRAMLDEDGNATHTRGRRDGKAVSQKTKRGVAATQTSWLMHELTLLRTLHSQGGDVPEPIACGESALLMEFIGDDHGAAPILNDIELDADEARPLFERVIFNVELLLGMGWVHGDLSAYNMLYQSGRIVLIDFPQVVDCNNNPRARSIFERDIERVSQYFERCGVSVEPKELAQRLWTKHVPEPEVLV